MPFLKRISVDWTRLPPQDRNRYPFDIPAIRGLEALDLRTDVTFFVGDNGSGKSTLLEAIGESCGFSIVGGKDLVLRKEKDDVTLAEYLRLSWMPKVNGGLFFRAETFDAFADYIDEMAKDPYIGRGAYAPYGGKSLHERSHGQAFLSFIGGRFGRQGLYLLDEPESALSPQNQLTFLAVLRDMERSGIAQFIIATHSPILMAYPGADILQFDGDSIRRAEYEDTEHYRLTRDFLNHRERYFRNLFDEEDELE
ncbi:AAA family ATPase [Cohnella sp. CFH 77786]|uniref:AAA family ATPase n=1 Tax=Cohnella sp. CFH 77786 TaxID=2662265 RepID=UPI001C608779|nr:AAA family ATPase [Cohnella sp. CFH 77786]MBW5448327.1 AAA family ATPase [Cohnella sp. CFH 77786]